MLSVHYPELMGKIKESKGKKYLMVDDYMLDKVLDKIKEIIGIDEFGDTKILIYTCELPADITLKILVMLMTCIIKVSDKFYPQLYLEEVLFLK